MYQLLSELPSTTEQEIRNKTIDESFLVSSLIAEAFRTSLTETSEEDIRIGLLKLLDLKAIASGLQDQLANGRSSLDRFIHIAEELQVELTELLAALKKQGAESFSPKLDVACI